MGFQVKDDAVKNTRALPAAASSTVDGAAIDLGHGSKGDFLANSEFKLEAPAVTVGMLPNTKTFTYSIIHSDNADLSAPTVLMPSVIVQTGAAGAGAAAADYTCRLPVDVKRYVGVRITSSDSTTDASARSATFRGMF